MILADVFCCSHGRACRAGAQRRQVGRAGRHGRGYNTTLRNSVGFDHGDASGAAGAADDCGVVPGCEKRNDN
jgi:hypothetical protein